MSDQYMSLEDQMRLAYNQLAGEFNYLSTQLAAAREHAAAVEADAATLRALLQQAADYMHSETDGRPIVPKCLKAVDAALADRDPQAAVTAVGERKDE